MLEDIFRIEPDGLPGAKKVVSLKEAVSRSVRPGMKLHLNTGAYANAALREIIRQYRGEKPEFTLISAGVTTPWEISLVLSGLVKKAVTANYSYTYPTPRPIPLLQEMGKEGGLEIENWSLYTLEQRLMAGALGVGFMPAKSLVGTDVAAENARAFKVVSDPFREDRQIGVVKALRPDISFIHGCVADKYGNTVLAPPYFAGIWGPRAGREGVIVTVEKIVPTEFIRRHSALVKIPGYLVKYVCPVPFGSHPQGLASEGVGMEGGYAEDYDFIRDFVAASADREGFEKWLKDWLWDCESRDDYLQRLGSERIKRLEEKPAPEKGLPLKGADAAGQDGCNATEYMVASAAREIRAIVDKGGYNTILAGIGTAGLAAWLAFYMLRRENREITLLTGLGHVGYMPRPGDPFLMTLANVMSCTMVTDSVQAYGAFVGGAGSRSLSVLGTAQVDEYGNLNTVRIDDAPFIGLGGAADAVNASETIVLSRQARARFMEKVPFIGCPGERVRTLVTDLGVFRKPDGGDRFVLTGYVSDTPETGEEECLRRIGERCGWKLRTAPELYRVPPPTADELAILRHLDPERAFLGKK